MFFDDFLVQTQTPLQIIPFNAPPKPKPSSRRHRSKKDLSRGPGSDAQLKNGEDLAPTSHGAEVIDLTRLGRYTYNRRGSIFSWGCMTTNTSAGCEANFEISGAGSGKSDDVDRGDVNRDDSFSTANRCGSVGVKQSVSMQTSPEETATKSSILPVPFEDSSQGKCPDLIGIVAPAYHF